MHDETIPNETSGQSTGAAEAGAAAPVIKHSYYEVGSDVLSKPNALCDLLEVEGCPPTCVFCNTPSDADLVEVILKKRGISALKLIGHVPPMRSARTLKQIKSGEVCCLVVTDVSGQTIDVEELGMVVNYALPTAPEVYIHRCGHSRPGAKLSRVVSLIGALDIANLHYLRKIVEFDIEKAELPAKEQLSAAKLNVLRKQAIDVASIKDDRLNELTAMILKDDQKEALIGLLLRNTLEVLPSLQAGAQRADRGEEDFGGEDSRGERRQGRGDRDDRGGDRGGDRGDRGGDRGPRGGDRGDRGDRGGRGRGSGGGGGGDRDRGPRGYDDNNQGNRFPNEEEPYGADSYDSDRPQRGDRRRSRGGEDDDRPRRERTYVPPEKFTRVYLGHGNEHGITSVKLQELLTQECKVAADAIKLTNVRASYSFFDIPEEQADAIIDALNEVQHGHSKLFARRATTISVPRPQPEPSADEGFGDEGGGGSQDQDQAPGSDEMDDESAQEGM